MTTVDLRFEDGFRIDPDAVAAAVTPRTKLISVTVPHNPTGTMRQRGGAAGAGRPRGPHRLPPAGRRDLSRPVAGRRPAAGGDAGAACHQRVVAVQGLWRARHPHRLDRSPATRRCRSCSWRPRSRSASAAASSTNGSPSRSWRTGRRSWTPILAEMRRRLRCGGRLDRRRGAAGLGGAVRRGGLLPADAGGAAGRHGRLLPAAAGGPWLPMSAPATGSSCPTPIFRLGYGWPTAEELESGLAAISAALRG